MWPLPFKAKQPCTLSRRFLYRADGMLSAPVVLIQDVNDEICGGRVAGPMKLFLRPLRGLVFAIQNAYPRLAPWGYCLSPAPRGSPAGSGRPEESGAPVGDLIPPWRKTKTAREWAPAFRAEWEVEKATADPRSTPIAIAISAQGRLSAGSG